MIIDANLTCQHVLNCKIASLMLWPQIKRAQNLGDLMLPHDYFLNC